jgi:alpha-1,3/alpha-1,6-mannosyltransferase
LLEGSSGEDLLFAHHSIVICSLNRFERKKDLELALESFALVKQRNSELSAKMLLIIAGGYDERIQENIDYP